MPAQILDGKARAAQLQRDLAREVPELTRRLGRPPGLAVVQVGGNPASQIYVRNKRRISAELGLASFAHDLPVETGESDLLALVDGLNRQEEVDGILVQTPLPPQVRPERIFAALDPAKDVDGFHPVNLGKLFAGQPVFVPCTPAAILDLIHTTGVPLAGKKAVVVGRSVTVGRPAALLLLHEHATVTICHSRTLDLAAECRAAEVLVVAIGRRAAVRGDWIKPGAVVVDVGINRVENKLYGDVEFETAAQRAAFITPVPGGVGPMTIAYLMANTIRAARTRAEARA